MLKTVIILGAFALIIVAFRLLDLFLTSKKPKFQYARKDCIMTPAERECFAALVAEMGIDYYFFPQIHLDAIVSPRESRRNRLYAFRHINQKSVDFVACDKKNLRPLFVIELDDKTHAQSKRIERDLEVERILHGAVIPLVRIENRGRFDPKALAQEVMLGIDAGAARS
jgi:hypothetical protein